MTPYRTTVTALALASLAGAAASFGTEGGAVEQVHGMRVRDPYRTLESEEGARRWIDLQNRKTEAFLRNKGSPAAEARLAELLSIGVVSRARVAGARVFYQKREGSAEQPILYWRRGPGDEVPLVDPNARSQEGKVALDWYYPSRTGRYLAYGLSKDGDEESILRVLDVDRARDLPEAIPHTRACDVAWLPDDSGFYYTRYPEGGLYNRHVYLHELGESPDEDAYVFGKGREKTDWPSVSLSPDGKQVLLGVFRGWSRSELYLMPHGRRSARPLFVGHDARLDGAEWVKGRVLARTNLDAPRWRLVSIDPDRPEPEHWRTVVPEGAGVLDGHLVSGRFLIVHRVERAVSHLQVHDLSGRLLREVELPTLGSLSGLDAEVEGGEAVLTFSSYFHPPTVLALDPATGRTRTLARVRADVDTSGYVVQQVEYFSYDGTRVPMFLVHRRHLPRTGDHPTLVYGYGGFNVSLTPSFQRNLLFWLEHGGVYAAVNLRGGGELGETWHAEGKREKKFQVFADFEYALRYLSQEGYTRPDKLAVMGGSNGGLLVGAAVTRFPHLFRAAIGSVGLYDMLRYHRFPPAELWIDEYGDPEVAEEARYLHAYSPYHQVIDGVRYPACLLLTADKDTRVHWAHTAKFAARLQEATAGDAPILFHLSRKEGHGAGKGKSDIIRDYTQKYAFLFSQLGVSEGGR